MAVAEEITLLIDSKIADAVKGINTVNTKIGTMEQTAKKVSIGIFSSFNALKTGIVSIGAFITGGIIGAFAEMTSRAADFQEQSASLFNQFGVDSKKLLGILREASGGQISNFDLIREASRAMALGVTTDSETLGKLLEFATKKSDSLGKSAGEVFNTLVEGISKGSARVLTSVGINKEAFDRQGLAIDGVTSKSQLLSIVLSETGKNLNQFGNAGETAADKLDKARAFIDNIKLSIGSFGVSALNFYAPLIERIADFTGAVEKNSNQINSNLI
jgi:hypothetical protein